MEPQSKKMNIPVWVWILGAVALLCLCGVLAVGGLGLAFFSIFSTDLSPANQDVIELVEPTERFEPTLDDEPGVATPDLEPTTAPTEVPAPTDENSEEEAPTETGAADDQPTRSDPYAAERAQIEANVEAIRDLEAKEAVEPTLLTADELRQRLEKEFAEDYSPEEARDDAIALSAFDFLDPDFDLYAFTINLLTEQIAGFYDPETDEFVVIDNDQEFDVLERWTHAHEYVHALQDQYYDLSFLDDESLDSESTFALQALAEGEATLVQTLYLLGGYFSQEELLSVLTDSLEIDTAVLDEAPPFMVHELEFPYIQGMEFVQRLYDQDGFAGIDAAWANPPQSTEQILHPERYLAGDAPQIVALAPLTDTLGAGWEQADSDILGEFYLREYLAQQIGNDQVDEAASGWGGDRYSVYWNEGEQALVMALKLAWDTPADAQEFADIYPTYPAQLFSAEAMVMPDGGLCWQGQDVICFYDLGGESLVVRAPDVELAARAAEAQLP